MRSHQRLHCFQTRSMKGNERSDQNLDQALRLLHNFLCSAQLRMKFIIPVNVKMPTIVGILTFISMINTTSESLEAI